MPADSDMVMVPRTAEEVKACFGLDPDATGNRPRSWRIVDDAESSDLRGFNGLDIPPGSLAVHTRDGASNPICAEACRLPNFIGTAEDDFDRTYRDYFYAPLSASPVGEGLGASASPIPTEGHGAAVVTPDDWWIEWFGGKCPVARRTLVTVRRRDGREVCDMALKFDWTNENYAGVDSDIVAYRVEAAPSTTSTAEQVGTSEASAPNHIVDATEMVAPSPGEGDARLCPCGKPSLPTASICSDCADACLASGEAPVARRILWGPGEDWDFSNEADDPLTDADVERLRAQGYVVDRLYTRPTPATPEGLREKVEEAFRAGWDAGFTGAMNSGPLPDQSSAWLKYSKPSLSVVES